MYGINFFNIAVHCVCPKWVFF